MRVFVTGGTGCVGSHVVDKLRAADHEVLALVRKTSDTKHLLSQGVTLVVGDVTDAESLRKALVGNGVDAVVHAAAVVSAASDWSHYEEVGVRGTAYVVQAMIAAGCKRLIHVSSIAAYGMGDVPDALTEDQPLADDGPTWNHYVREKTCAEKVVWAAQRAGDIQATVLRPGVILGARDRNVAPGILANLASERGAVLGDGSNQVACIAVEDVADAIVLSLQTPASAGHAYNLSSDEVRTQLELYEMFARAVGKQVPASRVSLKLALFLARAFNGWHKLMRRPGAPPMNPIGAVIWGSHSVVNSSLAHSQLGWNARIGLEQSVQDWVKWHQSSPN